ncbi:MAG: C4-type zinc ribbon domain-containing protein [bacterium]
MLEELNKLVKLQEKEDVIIEKEDMLFILPEENEEMNAKMEEMQKELSEKLSKIDLQNQEKKKRQEILEKGEKKLKNITGKQSAIRNREEYDSLLREIDNIKRFNKELENEIAEIDKELEIKQEELDLIKKESEDKIKEYSAKIDENKKVMEKLQMELDELYSDRDEYAENIRKSVLLKFERILETSPDGKAIAFTENYRCFGCNMNLPPQLYNDVLKSKRVNLCPGCQRILIPVQEENKSSSED